MSENRKEISQEEKIAEEQNMTLEQLLEEGKYYEMIYDGNITDGAVLLGQSIGIINSIENVSDIIESIVNRTEKCIKKVASIVN